MSFQNTTQQKQQQTKEKKPANDFSQIGQQKKQKPKEPKPTKVSDNLQKEQPQSKLILIFLVGWYFIWVILNIDKNDSQIPPNVTKPKQQPQKPTKVPEKQLNGKERNKLIKKI